MRWRQNREGFGFGLVVGVVAIVSITLFLCSFMFAQSEAFARRRRMESAAISLRADLMLTQQFARSQRNGYNYYGLRLLGGLGENGDRFGYEIVRYEPIGLVPPINLGTVTRTLIKSSNQAAVPAPELLEDTFFGAGVVIDAAGSLEAGSEIIFIPEGSATSNGQSMLAAQSTIILSVSGEGTTRTLTITPLAGHVTITTN